MLLSAPIASGAQSTLSEADVSPDITVLIGSNTIDDQDVVKDDFTAGPFAIADLGAIPASAEVTAYHLASNGDRLFALDTTADLGGFTALRGDVLRYDGVTYTVEFDSAGNGIPAGTITDAVSVSLAGLLLLSFDTTVDLISVVADDEDLVSFDPGTGTFGLVFDGSAAGIDPALDLNAAAAIRGTDRLLLSFDTSGSVSPLGSFDDEDLLEWEPVSGTWAAGLTYDGDANHVALAPADVTAFDGFVTGPCALLGGDTDGDGICDAGDGSGLAGDATCIGGATTGCDDNCVFGANPLQEDVGGQLGAVPDGNGDARQCGDMNGDGKVNNTDKIIISRFIGGLPPGISNVCRAFVGP